MLKKNPVASAFSLVLVFFCFAGIYALMDAHLVAAMQVLVYAGAIMVLFVFVIMLLNADSPSLDMLAPIALRIRRCRLLRGVACAVLLSLSSWSVRVPRKLADSARPR